VTVQQVNDVLVVCIDRLWVANQNVTLDFVVFVEALEAIVQRIDLRMEEVSSVSLIRSKFLTPQLTSEKQMMATRHKNNFIFTDYLESF